MFPLGVLRKKQAGNGFVLRLSLPFDTNATDTSGNANDGYSSGTCTGSMRNLKIYIAD